jgi:serine/threonine protein kinase
VTPERWKQVERGSEARSSFIAKACGGDEQLRREVEHLLESNATEFLEQPALIIAAQGMARSNLLHGDRRLQPGTRLGPYEITEQIGKGGMGEVYRATDTRLQRIVAVKVLLDAAAVNPRRRERLELEARAISRLNHPHICTLHDVGEQDGIYYLVMEFVEGETLAATLRKGRLSVDRTLEYALQITSALDEAHLQGVVHRDLKTDNIMITKSGVKLLDFGLAKLKSDAGVAPGMGQPSAQDPSLTAAGTILGTLQYMAPEQLEGKKADVRTDIFAFGAVVYEMFTGKRAFNGQNQASLIAAIMTQEPEPMESSEPLASALSQVVKTCLEKSPNNRWRTAGDLKRELTRVSSGDYTSRPAPRNRRSWGWGRLLLAAGSILLLAQVITAHLSGDPWILGYFAGMLLASAFFSLVLTLFQGQNQKHIAYAAFFIVAVLVSGAVWWRNIDLQHYISDPASIRRPAGFCYGHYGFVPYFFLLGSSLFFTTYMIHSRTREGANKANQRPILVAFSILAVYLFGCRLVWEYTENKALEQLRKHPSIEFNCSAPAPQ